MFSVMLGLLYRCCLPFELTPFYSTLRSTQKWGQNREDLDNIYRSAWNGNVLTGNTASSQAFINNVKKNKILTLDKIQRYTLKTPTYRFGALQARRKTTHGEHHIILNRQTEQCGTQTRYVHACTRLYSHTQQWQIYTARQDFRRGWNLWECC